jgi:EAL domain-containing protein (putative c-di-GMP-specific phosphodiesterase class I)
MNDAISERVLLEKHLRTALDNNEFVLHYQPQLDIATNKVSGLEALIRWNSPELGFVSPLKFISIAEDTHLIIPIGEWVLKNACLFLKKLHQQGYSDMLMSVNISMLQLIQDDFANKVMEILDELKLDPKYLELEITESILMESYEAIAEKLKLLKGKGVRIALDDFGKGYSSLNYLKQLPISTLKIDKSFVDTISADDKNKSLTDLIVTIGITMGLCVVAEGVETQEQLDYLVEHKCSKIQGYFFSRPVPDEAVVDAIKEREGGQSI